MTGNYIQEIRHRRMHNCSTNNLSGITIIVHSSYYTSSFLRQLLTMSMFSMYGHNSPDGDVLEWGNGVPTLEAQN